MAINPATHQQPDPVPNNQPYAVDRLCEFIEKNPFGSLTLIEHLRDRKQLGLDRYGTALQPFNGRSAAIDLYQELLDALIYCQQGIDEGEKWETLRDGIGYLLTILQRASGIPQKAVFEDLVKDGNQL